MWDLNMISAWAVKVFPQLVTPHLYILNPPSTSGRMMVSSTISLSVTPCKVWMCLTNSSNSSNFLFPLQAAQLKQAVTCMAWCTIFMSRLTRPGLGQKLHLTLLEEPSSTFPSYLGDSLTCVSCESIRSVTVESGIFPWLETVSVSEYFSSSITVEEGSSWMFIKSG